MQLYDDLTPWYRLVDPPGDHAEEAATYESGLVRAASGDARSLLELGAGAGHNAVHLKRRFRCTLSDLSPAMLALSRELNPECEHVAGDMRTLRLGRTFDAVLVHDAIVYMTSETDLRAAIETAFVHTRPGGAALFAPDFVRERFRAGTALIEGEAGDRALRCIEWCWDPDPADCTYRAEYAFLLREGNEVRSIHDRHLEGLFPRATWIALLEATGYRVELIARPIDEEGGTDEVFLCRRP
ncbi:MAG: class I SAM-dependent methyltransferase [Vicinamibacteria bacterium]|nr:class I SAM-dependent methyltransferase [Vicinamibacteria bacterium]